MKYVWVCLCAGLLGFSGSLYSSAEAKTHQATNKSEQEKKFEELKNDPAAKKAFSDLATDLGKDIFAKISKKYKQLAAEYESFLALSPQDQEVQKMTFLKKIDELLIEISGSLDAIQDRQTPLMNTIQNFRTAIGNGTANIQRLQTLLKLIKSIDYIEAIERLTDELMLNKGLQELYLRDLAACDDKFDQERKNAEEQENLRRIERRTNALKVMGALGLGVANYAVFSSGLKAACMTNPYTAVPLLIVDGVVIAKCAKDLFS